MPFFIVYLDIDGMMSVRQLGDTASNLCTARRI